MKNGRTVAREERTARLTILIDPRKKAVFESVCAAEDLTPSQIVRSLIRSYIEERLGEPWRPDSDDASKAAPAAAARTAKRRPARS
jgi:hypothetical protein